MSANTDYIFITHSTKDKEVADQIRAHLESNGIKCWIAPRDIPIGEEWAKGIITGINNASGMLLVLSQHSNNSPQVRREIERGIHNDIPIFPVRIEDIEPSDAMEYYISSHQWMDFFDSKSELGLGELIDRIRERISRDETESSESPEIDLADEPLDKRENNGKHSLHDLTRRNIRKGYVLLLVLAVIAVVVILVNRQDIQESTFIASGIEQGESSYTPLNKIFHEDGAKLSPAHIQPALDGGYIMMGTRIPRDTTESWTEIWAKKLDANGAEEWEYVSRDTLGICRLLLRRDLHVVQLPDSSFLFGYGLARQDSLVSDSTLRGMEKFRYNDISREHQGAGFQLRHISRTGQRLNSAQYCFKKGTWESCRIRSMFRESSGAIFLNIVGRNVNHRGQETLLLRFPAVDSIAAEEQFDYINLPVSYTVVSKCHYSPQLSKVFYINSSICPGGCVFVYKADSAMSLEYATILEVPPIQRGNSTYSSAGEGSDYAIPQIAGIREGRIYGYSLYFNWAVQEFGYVFYCTDLQGRAIWSQYLRDTLNVNHEVADAEPYGESGVVFSGCYEDSLCRLHPLVGRLDSDGDTQWIVRMPHLGIAKDLCVLPDGTIVCCIEIAGSGDIELVSIPSNGEYSHREVLESNYTFLETWDIESDYSQKWDSLAGSPVSSQNRGNIIEVAYGQELMRDTIQIRDGVSIAADILVPHSLPEYSYVALAIKQVEDTDAPRESCLPRIQWNYGSSAGEGRLLLPDTNHSYPDSDYVSYGNWNRLEIAIDSLEVVYFINKQRIHSVALADSIIGTGGRLCIEIRSRIPIFIDSILVKDH